MRLFAFVAVLLIAGGVYLIVDGCLRVDACIDAGTFSHLAWTSDFWLENPSEPARGISANAQWLLRMAGGLLALGVGWLVVRITRP